MARQALMSLALAAACCPGAAASSPGGADNRKVEVALAAEHARGVRPGDRVDLLQVVGAVTTATGRTSYSTSTVVRGVEVASVQRAENPPDPARAVRVELLLTPEQAAKVERLKAARVEVAETRPGGARETVKRPVTFRLEPSKPGPQ
jgi:DNA replicative helicase MCM subunit Mcm2 (Cdc46/Mcm family)